MLLRCLRVLPILCIARPTSKIESSGISVSQSALYGVVTSKNVNKEDSRCSHVIIQVWPRCNHAHTFKDADMIL